MKLGRLPRGHNPRIAHLSSIMAGATLPPPPAAVDYTAVLPATLGAMLNDSLGDCTCAAFFHALQVWSANTASIDTEPDASVLALYEGACGYNPADPSTDQGGMEQAVLAYLLNTGAQTSVGVHKLTAFVEVDTRNVDDVKRTIYECGVAYIGFNVPSYLMDSLSAPGSTWDVETADADIVGGHAVVLAGYDATGATVISWGNIYHMTWAFFAAYVDEVYALCDADWIAATGLTPAGQTVAQLEALMQGIKEAA